MASRKSSRRECPQCAAAMRGEAAHGEVALDRCCECDGLWFDGGELAVWIAARGRQPSVPPVDAADSPAAATVAPPGRCPACSTLTLEWRVWNGAPVGGCASCRGLFVQPQLQQSLDRPVPPPPRASSPIEPPRDVPTWAALFGGVISIWLRWR